MTDAQRRQEELIQATGWAVVDIFQTGGLAQADILEAGVAAAVGTFRHFPVQQ